MGAWPGDYSIHFSNYVHSHLTTYYTTNSDIPEILTQVNNRILIYKEWIKKKKKDYFTYAAMHSRSP